MLPARSCDLHQPVRRFGQNRECGKFAAHHGDFVAAVKSGTDVAIFVNLVGKVFPLRHLESLACKKFWRPREQADAIHAMPFRLGHQSFYQPTAAALALS